MKVLLVRAALVLGIASFLSATTPVTAIAQVGGGAAGGGAAGVGIAGGTTGTGGRTFTNPGSTAQNLGTQSTGTQAMGTETGASTLGEPVERRFSDVGTTTGGAAGGLGGLGGMRGFGGGGLGGLSPFGLNPFGAGAGSTEQKSTIRTRLKSEVVVPPRSVAVTSANSQQRMNRSYGQPRFRGVGAQVTENGTVLSGTVATEADRRMAELMMRLEPGVNRIDNQIIVAQWIAFRWLLGLWMVAIEFPSKP
jgi:hypothetical protein